MRNMWLSALLGPVAFVGSCSPATSSGPENSFDAAPSPPEDVSEPSPVAPEQMGSCAFNKSVKGTPKQCAAVTSSADLPVISGTISAPQLSVAYIRNQVAADDAFTLHRFKIEGPIAAIKENAESVTVEYAAPYEMPIIASLSDYQVMGRKIVTAHEVAAKFEYGSVLRLTCDNRGVVSRSLALANCAIEVPPPISENRGGTAPTPTVPQADSTAPAPTALPAIVQKAMQLDEECRGGQHDPDDTTCVARDRSFDRAKEAGWCYGTDSDTEAEREWQRCTN